MLSTVNKEYGLKRNSASSMTDFLDIPYFTSELNTMNSEYHQQFHMYVFCTYLKQIHLNMYWRY